jgi:hypothetical protein
MRKRGKSGRGFRTRLEPLEFAMHHLAVTGQVVSDTRRVPAARVSFLGRRI